MIDVKKYLESGIIELYCLGLASSKEGDQLLKLCKEYPEIAQELSEVESALTVYLSALQKAPSKKSESIIKQLILENEAWGNAHLVGTTMQLENFINISRTTDIKRIKAVIKNLLPPDDYENMTVHQLYAKGDYELSLVWVKDMVPMEEHPQVDERFLILEGTADCHIDTEIFKMKAGDFMQIPSDSHHKVVITSSSPAKAILTRAPLLGMKH